MPTIRKIKLSKSVVNLKNDQKYIVDKLKE